VTETKQRTYTTVVVYSVIAITTAIVYLELWYYLAIFNILSSSPIHEMHPDLWDDNWR